VNAVELRRAHGKTEESKIRRSEAVIGVHRNALRASGSQRIADTSSAWSRAVCIYDSLTACMPAARPAAVDAALRWPAGALGASRCRLIVPLRFFDSSILRA